MILRGGVDIKHACRSFLTPWVFLFSSFSQALRDLAQSENKNTRFSNRKPGIFYVGMRGVLHDPYGELT